MESCGLVTYRLHFNSDRNSPLRQPAQLADARAQAKVATRVDRLAAGNFGGKSLRQGLYELRVHWGPGYRVYYAMIGEECVLLLCGGDKRKQAADIERALEYLLDYKERSGTT